MSAKQQEEQKRNFAITKAKLEQVKPDPSISIDDFISRMLVSPISNSKSAWRRPTDPAGFLPETTDVGHHVLPPTIDGLSNLDDIWGNFRSSSDANVTANDDGFAKITSFAPSFISSNFDPKPGLNFDFSQPAIPNFQSMSITSQSSPLSSKSTNADVESIDEFSDFVGSQKPVVSPKSLLNHSNTSKSVESFGPLFPAVSNDKDLISKPTPPEVHAAEEDGFEDFQGCAFESAPPPVELTRKELPTEGWLKCLSECQSMLSESASILSPLATDPDIDTFLSTSRGNDHIYELIEIYGICQRIRLAASINNISDPQLQEVFNQIDQTWGDLAKFVKNQEHKQTLGLRLAQSIKATSPVDALSVEPNCGVCVTPVSSLLSSTLPFGSDPGIAVISLAGRVYHASCANLWVNRVELSLPALRAA
ncbi:hypothetical protein Aperf_G00000104075 [Anoplocephala perfoliata]